MGMVDERVYWEQATGPGVGVGVGVGDEALPRKIPESTALLLPVLVKRKVTFPLIFQTRYVP